jgi:hypothetical protein
MIETRIGPRLDAPDRATIGPARANANNRNDFAGNVLHDVRDSIFEEPVKIQVRILAAQCARGLRQLPSKKQEGVGNAGRPCTRSLAWEK